MAVFVYSSSTPDFTKVVGTYATIQDAIDAGTTLDGYSVFVDDGTYALSATLNINKSLNFFGEQTGLAGTGSRPGPGFHPHATKGSIALC